jgi:hypothetical protein
MPLFMYEGEIDGETEALYLRTKAKSFPKAKATAESHLDEDSLDLVEKVREPENFNESNLEELESGDGFEVYRLDYNSDEDSVFEPGVIPDTDNGFTVPIKIPNKQQGGDNNMTGVGPNKGDVRELSGKARHDYATKQLLEQDLVENEAEAEKYAEVLIDVADTASSYEEEFEQMGNEFQQVVDDMVTYLDGNQNQLENMRDKVKGIERTLEGAVRTAYEVEGVDTDSEDFEYNLGPIGRLHLDSLHNFVESVYGEDN